MIYKGLDDEESGFLTFVAQRKAEQEADVIRNEIKEVVAYRVSWLESVSVLFYLDASLQLTHQYALAITMSP